MSACFEGDFAAETVYSNDPAEILARYRAFGARRIHVVDLDGAKDGTQANRDAIVKFASDRSLNLQVGGGLRSLERVKALLDAGVERAVIGSVAINSPGCRDFVAIGSRPDAYRACTGRATGRLRHADAHDARLAANEQRQSVEPGRTIRPIRHCSRPVHRRRSRRRAHRPELRAVRERGAKISRAAVAGAPAVSPPRVT